MVQQALSESYSELTGNKSTAHMMANLKYWKVLVPEDNAHLFEKVNFDLAAKQECKTEC
jgi:hypothetical protein